MWPWDEDEGPFYYHFWFTCSCGAEWDEFRELESREDAEKQVAKCIQCWSDEPVEPCHFEEMRDDDTAETNVS